MGGGKITNSFLRQFNYANFDARWRAANFRNYRRNFRGRPRVGEKKRKEKEKRNEWTRLLSKRLTRNYDRVRHLLSLYTLYPSFFPLLPLPPSLVGRERPPRAHFRFYRRVARAVFRKSKGGGGGGYISLVVKPLPARPFRQTAERRKLSYYSPLFCLCSLSALYTVSRSHLRRVFPPPSPISIAR